MIKQLQLGLLVLALLLAQSLGVWHGIVHTTHFHHSDEVNASLQGDAHVNPQSSGFLERLFSSHQQDSDCRVFDQLSHAYALPSVPFMAMPLLVWPSFIVFISGLAKARWHAQFHARGPPAVR